MSDKVLTTDCHVDEWAEFWLSKGFRKLPYSVFRRDTEHSQIDVQINMRHVWIDIGGVQVRELDNKSKTPLQQIADELDELANTKIMGGWA